MSVQEKIVGFLREKYDPDAIILHGSRASGNERPHSDWDFLLLFNTEPTAGNFRELVVGGNIEVQSEQTTIEEGEVLDTVGLKLMNAKVVFEKNGEGTTLLEKAKRVYQEGFQRSDAWLKGVDLWMRGRIGGMRDTVDDPLLFHRYFCQFYPRAISDWFRALHSQFPRPEYLALPYIKDNDPEYYELLTELVDQNTSLQKKADITEKIREKLFG